MTSQLDLYLQDRLPKDSVFRLTDQGRNQYALRLPARPGVRVAFTSNIGAVLTHDNVPPDGMTGTVILVRTAQGDRTAHDDNVFVKWDDGKMRMIHRHYLRPAPAGAKTAEVVTRRVEAGSLGDLTEFLIQGTGTELVHKATKDLWSLQPTDGGDYLLNRLFQENGDPLKV